MLVKIAVARLDNVRVLVSVCVKPGAVPSVPAAASQHPLVNCAAADGKRQAVLLESVCRCLFLKKSIVADLVDKVCHRLDATLLTRQQLPKVVVKSHCEVLLAQ